MSKPPDSYEITQRDIRLFARQLIATCVREQLEKGAFKLDIEKFGEKEQKKIISELKRIIYSFDSIDERGKEEKGYAKGN